MTTHTEHRTAGPASLAASLLETLEQECAALNRLKDQFDRQLTAVRDRDQEGVEETAVRTSDEVNVLAHLKLNRDRQIRLLGKVLRLEGDRVSLQEIADALEKSAATSEIGIAVSELREQIKRQAQLTQDRCRDLEFALQYSVHLGRELLQVVQGSDVAPGGRHYTSNGLTVDPSSGRRSILNRVG